MDIQPNNNTLPVKNQSVANGYGMMPGLQNQDNGLYEPEVGLMENVRFTIEGNKNNIKLNGTLNISDQQYWFQITQQNTNLEGEDYKQLSVQYRATETIGTNVNSLIIFINSQKKEQDSDQQQQLSTSDELIEILKKQKKGNFCLQGQCTLIIQFNSKQTMQKAYDLLSLYVGEQDEGNSQYDENEQMDQMISADNIDQNGNIILNKQEQQEESEKEDDNMMEEQN